MCRSRIRSWLRVASDHISNVDFASLRSPECHLISSISGVKTWMGVPPPGRGVAEFHSGGTSNRHNQVILVSIIVESLLYGASTDELDHVDRYYLPGLASRSS